MVKWDIECRTIFIMSGTGRCLTNISFTPISHKHNLALASGIRSFYGSCTEQLTPSRTELQSFLFGRYSWSWKSLWIPKERKVQMVETSWENSVGQRPGIGGYLWSALIISPPPQPLSKASVGPYPQYKILPHQPGISKHLIIYPLWALIHSCHKHAPGSSCVCIAPGYDMNLNNFLHPLLLPISHQPYK